LTPGTPWAPVEPTTVDAVEMFFASFPFFPSEPFTPFAPLIPFAPLMPFAPCILRAAGHLPFVFGPEMRRLRVSI
jgi:hypothetical protein